MKKALFLFFLALLPAMSSHAQVSRTVQNRPYTDLRLFHFGILVGTHVQDIEFMNAGPQTIVNEDGTETTRLITADQDRWDEGFSVGVLGELRLSKHFQFRVAPAMYFGVRHMTFYDFTARVPSAVDDAAEDSGESSGGIMLSNRVQTQKTAYVTCAADLIFASQRNGNVRPYVMAGLNPVINLSGSENDIIKLKRTELFFEIGAGCDFYMPFFKLRPELKFMFGLTDCLDHDHPQQMRDGNLRAFVNSVSKATSKMIALTFYFE
ncbi:MAG: PorT family protein [Prevotella sp.]|nr:PorT family protein [Prevotella sp.]